jgi:hypothetical protein
MAMNETFSPPDMPPPGPTAPLNGPAQSLRKCADNDAAAAMQIHRAQQARRTAIATGAGTPTVAAV